MFNDSNCRNVGLEPYRHDTSQGVNRQCAPDDEDIKILASYHAVNQSAIGAFFGMLFMIILLVCLVSLTFGLFIYGSFSKWGIAAVISALTIVVIGPIALRIRNWTEHKNYEYWLQITDDWLFCAKAPKQYRKLPDYEDFLHNQAEHLSSKEWFHAIRALEADAKAQTQENYLNGLTVFCLSRHFRIYTTSKHIELWDGKHQVYLPYDSNAVAFLKDVALICDVSYANKTEETKRHGVYFRETVAILVGLLAGYAFQLFAMLTAYASSNGDFLFSRAEVFTPSLPLMAVPAILITWLAFGFAHVRWMRTWTKISTVLIFGFGVPFMLICMGAIFLQPSLFHQSNFFIVAVAVSLVFMVKVGIPASRELS